MVVYEVTCLADGHRYIGRTTNPLVVRWFNHCQLAKRPGKRAPLHRAMREHGHDRFTIREVACARTEPELRALERIIIEQEGTAWPAGFNADLPSLRLGKAAWLKRNRMAAIAERHGIAEATRAMQSVRNASDARIQRWLGNPVPQKHLRSGTP